MKIPKHPEQILDSFKVQLKDIFSENLISVILFGSAARGEYIYKKSDINFLVILKDNTPSELLKYKKIQKKWLKGNVATPLFLTEEYIKSSLDTYPIEFMEMKSAYKVVDGKDVLEDLEFDKKNLRLQAERELKSKLLHLRQLFLTSKGCAKILSNLITNSMHSLTPVYRAVLYLTGEHTEVHRNELINHIAKKCELDETLLNDLLAISIGIKKLSKKDVNHIFDKYVEELDKLAKYVDKIEI